MFHLKHKWQTHSTHVGCRYPAGSLRENLGFFRMKMTLTFRCSEALMIYLSLCTIRSTRWVWEGVETVINHSSTPNCVWYGPKNPLKGPNLLMCWINMYQRDPQILSLEFLFEMLAANIRCWVTISTSQGFPLQILTFVLILNTTFDYWIGKQAPFPNRTSNKNTIAAVLCEVVSSWLDLQFVLLDSHACLEVQPR